MRMMNGGILPQGRYGTVVLEGEVSVEEDVWFDTLWLRSGSLTAPALMGRTLRCQGRVEVTGDVCVERIDGYGVMRVEGDVVCERMAFTGDMSCAGRLRADSSLEFSGRMQASGQVEASWARLTGVIEANELDSDELEVSTLDASLLTRLMLRELTPRSHVGTVRSSRAAMRRTSCGSITADTLTLRDGSHADMVRVDGQLSLDATSSAMLVRGEGKRVHVSRA